MGGRREGLVWVAESAQNSKRKTHKSPCAVFNFSARPVNLFLKILNLYVLDGVFEESVVTIIASLSRTKLLEFITNRTCKMKH